MNKIKEYRKKKRLSQTDIAKMLNIEQSTFSQWENGSRVPSLMNAIKLAEVLDTNVESLYN